MTKLPSHAEFEQMRKSSGKGFTRKLLADWGVSWPPRKGWAEEFAARLKVERKAPAKTRSEKSEFYASWEWKTLRMKVLERHGRICMCCGATPEDGAKIVVDHIKPLGEFWGLRLDETNMQVLCEDCNMGKGNWLHRDFRKRW